jgi:hypothetical protein
VDLWDVRDIDAWAARRDAIAEFTAKLDAQVPA